MKNIVYIVEKRESIYFLLKVLRNVKNLSETKYDKRVFVIDPSKPIFFRKVFYYMIDMDGKQFTFDECKQLLIPPTSLQEIFDAKVLNKLVHADTSVKRQQIVLYILLFIMGAVMGYLFAKQYVPSEEALPI